MSYYNRWKGISQNRQERNIVAALIVGGWGLQIILKLMATILYRKWTNKSSHPYSGKAGCTFGFCTTYFRTDLSWRSWGLHNTFGSSRGKDADRGNPTECEPIQVRISLHQPVDMQTSRITLSYNSFSIKVSFMFCTDINVLVRNLFDKHI